MSKLSRRQSRKNKQNRIKNKVRKPAKKRQEWAPLESCSGRYIAGFSQPERITYDDGEQVFRVVYTPEPENPKVGDTVEPYLFPLENSLENPQNQGENNAEFLLF